jgi:hypothetical protein
MRGAWAAVGGGVTDMSLKTQNDDRLKVRAHPSRSKYSFGRDRRRFSGVHDSRGYDAAKVVHKVHAKRVYPQAG